MVGRKVVVVVVVEWRSNGGECGNIGGDGGLWWWWIGGGDMWSRIIFLKKKRNISLCFNIFIYFFSSKISFINSVYIMTQSHSHSLFARSSSIKMV